MPGESGLDFAQEVLADYPDTAVVMVTGADDRRDAETALANGAYGYMLKPFKPNELAINVANALRRRALEIENREQRNRLEQTVLERTVHAARHDHAARELRERAAPAPRGDDQAPRLGRGVSLERDRPAHPAREPLLHAARPPGRARRRADRDDQDREPDARRRQDRHPRSDPAQARSAHAGGAHRHGGAHGDGPPDPRRLGRRPARPRGGARADASRADGRPGLSASASRARRSRCRAASPRSQTSSTR